MYEITLYNRVNVYNKECFKRTYPGGGAAPGATQLVGYGARFATSELTKEGVLCTKVSILRLTTTLKRVRLVLSNGFSTEPLTL